MKGDNFCWWHNRNLKRINSGWQNFRFQYQPSGCKTKLLFKHPEFQMLHPDNLENKNLLILFRFNFSTLKNTMALDAFRYFTFVILEMFNSTQGVFQFTREVRVRKEFFLETSRKKERERVGSLRLTTLPRTPQKLQKL